MITLPPDVADALRQGNKIAAIKLLREKTQLGLAEAKAMVEQLEGARARGASVSGNVGMAHQAHGPIHTGRPGLGPGEVSRSSAGVGLAFALVVAAAFAWAWWAFA